MSLPTNAFYFDKDDNIIHTEFVNVGWYLDYQNWIKAVNELPIIENATFIQLYSVKFPVSWIGTNETYLQQLFLERNFKFLKDLDGSKYFKKTYGFNWSRVDYWEGVDNKSVVSNSEIEKRWLEKLAKLPLLSAEQILGVQPMTEPTGEIFKFNFRYEND